MGHCPKCHQPVKYLTVKEPATYEAEYHGSNEYNCYRKKVWDLAGGFQDFYCPKCGEKVSDDADRADEIIYGDVPLLEREGKRISRFAFKRRKEICQSL